MIAIYTDYYKALNHLWNEANTCYEMRRIKDILMRNNYHPEIIGKFVKRTGKECNINMSVEDGTRKFLGSVSYIGWCQL